MKHLLKTAAVGLLGLATLMPAAYAAPAPQHRRPPRVVFSGGVYRPVYRPAPYWYYRAYDPFWDPFWSSSFYAPAPRPTTGELKIKDPGKNVNLYIDGGLVGPAHKFKKTDLTPGRHDVELRNADGVTVYRQTVTVVLGKTTELRPFPEARG